MTPNNAISRPMPHVPNTGTAFTPLTLGVCAAVMVMRCTTWLAAGYMTPPTTPPGWSAATVQVPAANGVTMLPATVQMSGLRLV